MSGPVTTALRDDPFRGEMRWERQALEALLLSDKVDRVYSLLGSVWKSSSERPKKLVDVVSNSDVKDTVGIFYYYYNIAKSFSFRGVLFNFHIGPGMTPEEYEYFKSIYGSKFVLTHDCAVGNSVRQKIVEEQYGVGAVVNLPTPGVPSIHNCNNFDKDIILVYVKNLFALFRYPQTYWGDLFPWIADKLREDSNKKVLFVTGYCRADLDFAGIHDMESEFWSYVTTRCLVPFKDRIMLMGAVGWGDILRTLSNTKIVIGPTSTGGMPIEAASYGIPMVGTTGSSRASISYTKDFLASEQSLDHKYFELMDKLYYDRDFYTKTGSSYRDFVEKFYTYDAFTNRLFDIFAERGMV